MRRPNGSAQPSGKNSSFTRSFVSFGAESAQEGKKQTGLKGDSERRCGQASIKPDDCQQSVSAELSSRTRRRVKYAPFRGFGGQLNDFYFVVVAFLPSLPNKVAWGFTPSFNSKPMQLCECFNNSIRTFQRN